MRICGIPLQATLKEKRLIAISHVGQLIQDIDCRHMRTDGVLETAGAVPMAVGAGVTKIGNAIAGDVANIIRGDRAPKIEPIPLPDGNFAYTRRDVASLLGNTMEFIINVPTLRWGRAAGNVIKGAADAFDIAVTDPYLDVGATVFGHAYPKKDGTILSQNREAPKAITQHQRKAATSGTPLSSN